MLGSHQQASKTPLKWRFAVDPISHHQPNKQQHKNVSDKTFGIRACYSDKHFVNSIPNKQHYI